MDLDRSNDQKTASVHFLRFELPAPMRAALAVGAGLAMGIDHPNYNVKVAIVDPNLRTSLLSDLRTQQVLLRGQAGPGVQSIA
ncbi:MAG: DUF3501 family protein [Burkholderiales bacterium]